MFGIDQQTEDNKRLLSRRSRAWIELEHSSKRFDYQRHLSLSFPKIIDDFAHKNLFAENALKYLYIDKEIFTT